jgi:hypothetical protein
MEQQIAMLWRLTNNHAHEALDAKEEAQAKIAELKEHLDNRTDELREANRKILRMGRKVTIQAPDREDSERESTPSRTIREGTPLSQTSSVAGSGRTAKFPDPPMLTDGKEPTYRAWSGHVQNKLRSNADWFYRDDPDQEEDAKVAYIKTRVGGKAYDHLSPHLEAERDAGRNPTSKEVLKFLENVFEDPDRRIKARQELKGLKMPYL